MDSLTFVRKLYVQLNLSDLYNIFLKFERIILSALIVL